MKHRIFLWLVLLTGTTAFIYWWENALTSISLSETVWTIYFHLTGQTDPGLASDLEFVTAIAMGFFLSYGGARLFLFIAKAWQDK